MSKPTIFISSTIYDFMDLRSSMKYWLDEMGFITQLSEYNDFLKDTTQNSYDACLDAVKQCDYFVLLIGARRGGLYPGEDISITRKEYRAAYQLAKEGKIKKIIVLIRQNVWDVKEDRKSLHRLLSNLKVYENDKAIDVAQIENYDSSILKSAEHIISFINEVTRNEEARAEKKPIMNWVHLFTTFEDVVKVLKSELGIKSNISIKIAEENVKNTLVYNMQNITNCENGKVCAYYLGFKDIRKKLLEFRKSHKLLNFTEKVRLTTTEVHQMSDFLLFFRNGIKDLDYLIFENVIASGVFLTYSRDKEMYLQNEFGRALQQMVREIKRLQQFENEFSMEQHGKLLDLIREFSNYPDKVWEFDFIDLAQLSSIYERFVNIQNLTSYMIQYMNTNNSKLDYPEILNGLVDSTRPSEEEILKVFQ